MAALNASLVASKAAHPGLGAQVYLSGRTPLLRASFIRYEARSVATTTAWCSSRSSKDPVVLRCRLVSVERPRARTTGGEELHLDRWAVFRSKDLVDQLTAARVLPGVATRRHADAAEPLGYEIEDPAMGTRRSSVSRRLERAPEAALAELMARDPSGVDVAVVMVDGKDLAGQCVVAALVVTALATLVPVGFWLGGTENKTVVMAPLADPVVWGLDAEAGLLVVIDGAKALGAGVAKVFGERAVLHRCAVDKRRHVRGHLPQEWSERVDRRLALIFANPDPGKGLDAAERLAAERKADHPDAAARLLESLDHIFTVRRLGIGGNVAEMLTCTNAIESMISVVRATMGNVKYRHDGGDEQVLGGSGDVGSSMLVPAYP